MFFLIMQFLRIWSCFNFSLLERKFNFKDVEYERPAGFKI